jgi:hypothetical protein
MIRYSLFPDGKASLTAMRCGTWDEDLDRPVRGNRVFTASFSPKGCDVRTLTVCFHRVILSQAKELLLLFDDEATRLILRSAVN